jgi:hypothetical protein
VNPAPRPGPFTVRLTEPARVEVARLIRRSQRWGLALRFTTALREIEQALIARPTTWGEERNRYPGARLVAYHQVFDQLHVLYAVHDEQQLVWITHLIPVLSHPLLNARWNGQPIG